MEKAGSLMCKLSHSQTRRSFWFKSTVCKVSLEKIHKGEGGSELILRREFVREGGSELILRREFVWVK